MPICIAFWVLMIVGFVFGAYMGYNSPAADRFGVVGWFFFYVVIALLGWAVCSAPIKG